MLTARFLLTRAKGKPRQADLRRAVSAAYYAVFHALCEETADSLIGTAHPDRTERAWVQTYRAIHHAKARTACKNFVGAASDFPVEAQQFALIFVRLQQKRHSADYDPISRFRKEEVQAFVDGAQTAISNFKSLPRRQKSAFAALMLFQKR